MSDSDKKRDHESNSEESDNDENWVGPLPSEAVPTKKRKSRVKIVTC